MKIISHLLLGLTLWSLAASVSAQSAEVPPGAKKVPVRNLAVCFLYAPNVPELYYLDAKNQYTQLKIDTVRFSSTNIIPDTASLDLYRRKETPPTNGSVSANPTASTPPVVSYELAQTWTLTPGKESIQRLYYYNADGQVQHTDWNVSPESHGPMQARVMNLLNKPLAIRFDTQQSIIGAGQQSILTAAQASKVSFGFQYGLERPDSPPFVSPLKILSFRRPQQRLTIIFSYVPSLDTGSSGSGKIAGYIPQDLRFYEDTDRIPTPPAPVIVLPKTDLR